MSLYVDSTALIALGEIQQLHLLSKISALVVITPTIKIEVKRSALQIKSAISAGWMKVETPDLLEVQSIQSLTRLDAGETELIEVASRISGRNAHILIDEGSAFTYVAKVGMPNLICLAQALYVLESAGHLKSCKRTMDYLVNNGHYRWAKTVRSHYETWCVSQGVTPV